MTTLEVQEFIKKIKVYYSYFSIDSEEALDEWNSKLKPYDKEDVFRKLEEHLEGDKADEIPKLHFITKYLRTTEEKERASNEYIIRCNLCGKEMYLSDYDNFHYERCLMIKALVPILKEKDKDINYEMLSKYDTKTLDGLIYKYLPMNKEIGKFYDK